MRSLIRRNRQHPTEQAGDNAESTSQPQPAEPAAQTAAQKREVHPLEQKIAPGDPLLDYLVSASGAVELIRLNFDSPALHELKAAGVKVVLPLVSQGELIGVLNLGPRRSDQDYSTDDRRMLNTLGTQVSPAVRLAQLVRQQQLEAEERQRMEQELRIARLVQQTLLPKEQMALPGWQIEAIYQPARAVGGDFYDFIRMPDGRLSLIIGDVTDKGVPSALVMAITRTLLRDATEEHDSPGSILAKVNNSLCPDIPPKMFVTCFYAVLDPASRRLVFANAGHDLPYVRRRDTVEEMYARGMPLGLMPGAGYDENEVSLSDGETILFYTDGLVEAHNPRREMFGFPRLKELMAGHPGGAALIQFLLEQQAVFTGPDWEQEDDTTLITLQCCML